MLAPKPITKTWLCDKEGPVVEIFGAGAGDKIWEVAPKHPDKTEVNIPDRYEDEPE